MRNRILAIFCVGVMVTGAQIASAQNTNTNTNTNTGGTTNANTSTSNTNRRNSNSNRTTTTSNRNNTNTTATSNTAGSNMDSDNSARDNSNNGNNRSMAAMTAMDQKFLMDAIMGNNAEIQLGQMAVQRATSPEVKSFAQMMVDHHTAANAELMRLAQGTGMAMVSPTMVDPMHSTLAEGMSRLSGADFDMAYIKSQLADHALALDMYDNYRDDGNSKDLKAYAKKTQPAIEQHYQSVRTMDMRMAPGTMPTAARTSP